MALTDSRAKSIAAKGDVLMDGSVDNLMLKSNGKKGRGAWVFRFVSPTERDASGKGKRRDMGLGSYPKISIAAARKEARQCHDMLGRGEDPIAQRDAAKALLRQRSNIKTFEVACGEYIELQKGRWREGSKSLEQWSSSLATYAYPSLGKKRVDELSREDFVQVLKPIWTSKPETATRLFQRCTKIMSWCRSTGLTTTNPMESVKDLLPSRPSAKATQQHLPSLPWQKVPDFVQKVLRNGAPGTCREALEFLILSGCRSGEVRGMKWDEVDLTNGIWTIPGHRMKAGKEHRVPLTGRMKELLSRQRSNGRSGELVFPAPRGGEFSDATMSKFLRDHRVPSDAPGRYATVHGFRSSLRVWGAENNVANDVMEAMLAHTERNAVVAAYKRTDLLDERRIAMESWGAFLNAPSSPAIST
ncbi:Integrase [Devosia enhydra]|uniref:Integrase n=1 Tax=Devosia enhydra TaxID=665118 RepID=A0A1K2I0V2_9HYPH|nr:site-specific integrase [Devosia enhydra]SFZ85412.1 Integrase [Devosia enhydra]